MEGRLNFGSLSGRQTLEVFFQPKCGLYAPRLKPVLPQKLNKK